MRKLLLLTIVVVSTFQCFAQIHFEKGYFIDSSGSRIECLIKYIDWENNPTKFDYKLSDDAQVLSASIEHVNEFVIYNSARFVKQTVNIDRSIRTISEMSSRSAPEFQKETVFLRLVIEGKASLFRYRDNNHEKYFFTTPNSEVEQLIFKEYRIEEGSATTSGIGKNQTFRQQLRNGLKCSDISLRDVESIRYEKKQLEKLFIRYNKCENSDYRDWDAEKKKKQSFNLTVRPGINFGGVVMRGRTIGSRNVDFSNELTFRIGLEGEYTLPFNRGKWSLLVEPTYQYYKPQKITDPQRIELNYQSVEVPVGLRHYFFLKDQSKIFLNGGVTFDLPFKSKIAFPSSIDLDVNANLSYFVGAGYKFFNRYSLEVRYSTNRDIINHYSAIGTKYDKFTVAVGYSLFSGSVRTN